jgi:hypothetical protein
MVQLGHAQKEAEMAELKTKPRTASVDRYVKGLKDPQIRADAAGLAAMMSEAAGAPPRLWGTSIIGFGDFHYISQSGREGDWFLIGFAPRKKELTLYLMSGLDAHSALLKKLGPHKRRGSCLYIRRLPDVHLPTLKRLLTVSVRATRKRFGAKK